MRIYMLCKDQQDQTRVRRVICVDKRGVKIAIKDTVRKSV